MECKKCYRLKCRDDTRCKDRTEEKSTKEIISDRLKEQELYSDALTMPISDFEIASEEDKQEEMVTKSRNANIITEAKSQEELDKLGDKLIGVRISGIDIAESHIINVFKDMLIEEELENKDENHFTYTKEQMKKLWKLVITGEDAKLRPLQKFLSEIQVESNLGISWIYNQKNQNSDTDTANLTRIQRAVLKLKEECRKEVDKVVKKLEVELKQKMVARDNMIKEADESIEGKKKILEKRRRESAQTLLKNKVSDEELDHEDITKTDHWKNKPPEKKKEITDILKKIDKEENVMTILETITGVQSDKEKDNLRLTKEIDEVKTKLMQKLDERRELHPNNTDDDFEENREIVAEMKRNISQVEADNTSSTITSPDNKREKVMLTDE